MKEKRSAATQAAQKAKKFKPTTSDFIANQNSKGFLSDNTDVISKLCNVNHGNLEACKDPNRQFLPSLREFFEEAIEQLDPANQVEKQYQLVQQTDWCWKALRLLAKRSAFYFMQNQNVKTIPEYIEAICNKIGKEFASEQMQLLKQSMLQINSSNLDQNILSEAPSPMMNNKEKEEFQDSTAANGNGNNIEKEAYNDNENECTGINSIEAENENSVQGNDDESQQLDDEQTNIINNQTAPIEMETDTIIKNVTIGFDTEPNEKTTSVKKFFDSNLIVFISQNIQDAQEWKDIVLHLGLTEEKIASVEKETNDLVDQVKKIFQFWTVK